MPGSHITFTTADGLDFRWEGRTPQGEYLIITDRALTSVAVFLDDDKKDALRRIVRDWDFAEEAKLHEIETEHGYPVGQTLKGCQVDGCPVHHPHECTVIHDCGDEDVRHFLGIPVKAS